MGALFHAFIKSGKQHIRVAGTEVKRIRETRLAERIGSTPFYAYDRRLITERDAPLPRNPNGKIDRKTLAHDLAGLFADSL